MKTYIPGPIFDQVPPNSPWETKFLTVQKIAINAPHEPLSTDNHPTLAVCGNACIGANNDESSYSHDAPTLFVSGRLGVGTVTPYYTPPSVSNDFEKGHSVKFQVLGDDDYYKYNSTQSKEGSIPLQPVLMVRAGFIGQADTDNVKYDTSGAAADLAYENSFDEPEIGFTPPKIKYIVIGTSAHRTQDHNDRKGLTAADVQSAAKKQWKRKKLRYPRKFIDAVVEDLLEDLNSPIPTPEQKYGVRVQWGTSVAALQLIDFLSTPHRRDAVLSWGGTEVDLLRFRYVGSRDDATPPPPDPVSRFARDLLTLDPRGEMRVRGTIISYRYGYKCKRR